MAAKAPALENNAVFSACGRYRYVLTRQVSAGTRPATFILLNPSTADATKDDPTIRRCVGFARRWGCAAWLCSTFSPFGQPTRRC